MRNVIGGNTSFGVFLDDPAVLEGNYIGTDKTGTKAFGNGIGVVSSGSDITIGGSAPGAGNVISGNAGNGITSGGPGPTTGLVIQGNFIGTDATGTVGLGNAFTGPQGFLVGDGIDITGGASATIVGNLISANPYGITCAYTGSGMVVQGNLIGTDVTGTTTTGTDGKSLGNIYEGIFAGEPSLIGGTTVAARNVISGNGTGIDVGLDGDGVVIQGNYIGTDITGTHALGNDGDPSNIGVDAGGIELFGGANTVVGNLISGNGIGMDIRGGDGTGSVIQGNLIGTDYTGTQPLGNGLGINFQGGGSNYTIGGLTPGAGNIISGNRKGVSLDQGPAVDTGNAIEGNFIGTNAAGATNLGNGTGVYIGGFSGTQIGGTTVAAANVIADNGTGMDLRSTSGSVIQGNSIIGNGGAGISLEGCFNNMVGGTTSGAGNTIASNGGAGILLVGAGDEIAGSGNSFLENSIHDNASLGIYLFNNNANDHQAAPVLTTAIATASGTTINGTLTSTPNASFRIEFFANQSPDPSGYGEGQTYLGSVQVTTDASGNASFTATGLAQIPAGFAYLSATATVVNANNTFGDSSAFSQDIVAPPTADAGGPYSIQEGQSLTLNGTASYSPSGAALTYAWDVNGAGTFTAATGVSPTLSWAQLQALGVTDEGNFTVQLRVTDSNGNTATSSTVTLTVTDAPLSASGLTVTPTAGAPFSGVLATFTDAYAAAPISDYSASINWGDGSSSTGSISANGSGGYNVNGSHTFAASGSYAISVTINDVGGSTVTASSTANVANLGQPIPQGQGAGIGFWHNKNGQALLDSFNGGSSSTALADWLASTFPNLYGANAGANNLTGKTNAQVAAFDLTLFGEHGPKLDAQVLATALNVYATTLSLGGTAGQSYGFLVDAYGLGAHSYNVGSNGAAFGVANSTTLNVFQILLAANQRASNGVLYNGDATLDSEANNVFGGINQAGGI